MRCKQSYIICIYITFKRGEDMWPNKKVQVLGMDQVTKIDMDLKLQIQNSLTPEKPSLYMFHPSYVSLSC
jgi:hypothetical protein